MAQLGWADRGHPGPRPVHVLPRHRRQDLFDSTETPIEYARRFFHEIRGLGHVYLYRVKGQRVRRIAARAW